jgi:hypothetical protein
MDRVDPIAIGHAWLHVVIGRCRNVRPLLPDGVHKIAAISPRASLDDKDDCALAVIRPLQLYPRGR